MKSFESINDSKFQPLTEEEATMMSGGGWTAGVTIGLTGPDGKVDYEW